MTLAPLRPIVLGLLCIGAAGCGGVSKGDYDQIRYGMNMKDVEKVLGKPVPMPEIEGAELSLEKVRAYQWDYLARVAFHADSVTGEIKAWGKKGKFIQVMFIDGQAVAKRQEGL